MRHSAVPLILSFSRKGRRNGVTSASELPLPLRERVGVRGVDVSQINDAGY